MTYKLLIEKLRLREDKIITKKELAEDCKKLKSKYEHAIGYLLKHNYLTKILRGIFYVMDIEERKYKRIKMSYREALAKALEIKKVENWYFGLESAIKLNNLTHEYIATETIISDKIFRSRPVKVFGNSIRFVKAKKNLFSFGIKKESFPYSDAEKTILDIIYLDKYRGRKDAEIKNKIVEYLEYINKKKLLKYSKHYPKTLQTFVEELND